MTDNRARSMKRYAAAAKIDYELLKRALTETRSMEALCKLFMREKHGESWRKLVNAAPVA